MTLEFRLTHLGLDKIYDLTSPENHERGMYSMTNQMLADMNNYVPLENDSLRMSGHVEDNRFLVWDTPYAAAQFTGWINGSPVVNYTTPGTGPYWDQVARGNHLKDWKHAYVQGANLL